MRSPCRIALSRSRFNLRSARFNPASISRAVRRADREPAFASAIDSNAHRAVADSICQLRLHYVQWNDQCQTTVITSPGLEGNAVRTVYRAFLPSIARRRRSGPAPRFQFNVVAYSGERTLAGAGCLDSLLPETCRTAKTVHRCFRRNIVGPQRRHLEESRFRDFNFWFRAMAAEGSSREDLSISHHASNRQTIGLDHVAACRGPNFVC